MDRNHKSLPQGTATVSIFRDLAAQRRMARLGLLDQRLGAAGAADYDQKPWGLLYKAIIDSVGASPGNFQLLYPFTPWNWATQDVGFVSAALFDFCAAVPQWSAVGAYTSSGDLFHQAYQQFLNVLLAATDSPELRKQILEAQDALTKATNDYTLAYTAAESVYNDTPGAAANKPPFTEWLASGAGKGWQTKITAATVKMDQAAVNYEAVVGQANTPGLADALTEYANEDFYSKLNDIGLGSFPKVPSYSVSQDAASWVDAVKAGSGPSGATMGFTNRDQAYDYSKTWAGGSASIKQVFWEVNIDGRWERISEFESDQELEVSVQFEAVDQIQIQPGPWYSGPFVRSMGEGPFILGYSAQGGDGNKAVFGPNGFISLLKTGMFVGYKPTFTISVSQATFDSFVEKFKVAGALRIGPFTIEADGGSEKAQWTSSASGRSFTGTSTSDSPLIIGLSLAQLPAAVDAAEVRAGELAEEPRGRAFRFQGQAGDVLAQGVTAAEAAALGAGSWAPVRAGTRVGDGISGVIEVTFSSGPASLGHGTLNDAGGPQPYLDYSGKPYPSSIDMKKATSVSFTPHVGKKRTFSKWEYFFNGGWVGPRILVDGNLTARK